MCFSLLLPKMHVHLQNLVLHQVPDVMLWVEVVEIEYQTMGWVNGDATP